MAKYDFTNETPFNEQPLYKQGYEDAIDKACEAFCNTLCPNECRLKSGICPFENQFRESMKKAMEE